MTAKEQQTHDLEGLRPVQLGTLNTWQSIKEEAIRRIRSGEWAAGSIIPTEAELAREIGCARATVNRALTALARDGLLERRRRVGTRVVGGAESERHLRSTLRSDVEASGASYHVTLIDTNMVTPPTEIAKALHLGQDDQKMLQVHQRHEADSDTICCSTVYIAIDRVPEFDEKLLGETEFFDWAERNLDDIQSRRHLFAAPIDSRSAKTLDAEAGEPAVIVERAAWRGGHPVALSRRIYHPDYRLSFSA
ncbi:MAG: GntR family transcriptional regulator [Paracoccus sp. (in: a-proteobacteria)]|nr:GntR family transcriptional regulator [Paracoccus sp. (in: a-proteobacteria)]